MNPSRVSSLLAHIRLRYLILAIIALGLIFFSLTYLGIRKARQSLLKIMVDQGKALVESLALSSNNAIQAGLLLETLSEQKFADIARRASERLQNGMTPQDVRDITHDNDLLSFDLLTPDLTVIASDRWAEGYTPEYPPEVRAEIVDIQETGAGYRSVTVVPADSSSPLIQYFVYPVAPDSDFIVMSAEAEYFNQIMQQIGIGYLIRQISNQAGIEYILLQSRDGIIFSSRPLSPILNIESDPFLNSLMDADTLGWRIHTFQDDEVLEIARRFESVKYPPGIYRIGMSLKEFHEISRGYDRGIIITAVVLFILTLLVVAVVSVNQNYFILDQSYRRIRSMTDTIFDRLSSAVLAYDAEGRIIAVNSALAQLTGIDADYIGKPLTSAGKKLQFDLPEKLTPGERLIGVEHVIKTPSGDRRVILVGVSSLPDDAGGGGVVLIHDITEQKQLEEESRRRERLSEMGDMAAGVAHEIRNPLNAISIATQRLKMEFEPKGEQDEYERLTKNILDETGRLNQILTRFLELAKTRAAEDRPLDLGAPIRRAIASLADEAESSGVTINYPEHEAVRIRAAEDKLQQVFINLIKNAIQAMPDGGEVTIVVDASDSGRVLINVTDNGPGFPPGVSSKIFQPYFTTKTDGSGLGLALAYKTVIDYGGSIEASNNPDGGARIAITLPRA